MDKRINKKMETYLVDFKQSIKEKMTTLKLFEKNPFETNQLLQFVFDYEKCNFDKEDFSKRKRVKNMVCLNERCWAKRANGEQCTRRKKESDIYCGTHLKGIPHGKVENDNLPVQMNKKMEVFAKDIKGIIYYLDNDNNVYQAEDIVSNKENPLIIAKYLIEGEKYSIPSLNI